MLDIAIIGAGPAGLTAGLYAARAGLSAVVFDGGFPGGQAATTNWVENYPGFPEGVGGPELGQMMLKQAERFGLLLRGEAALELGLAGEEKRISLKNETLFARAVILCMGASPRKLEISGEAEFLGRGVSYCASCDGALFRGQDVAVVGGGDTACEDALYLARTAKSVTLIHRRGELRAQAALVSRIEGTHSIRIAYDRVVERAEGEGKLTHLLLKGVKTGKEERLEATGLFVAIGSLPQSALVRGQIALRQSGAIETDVELRTSLPRVYAAGDLRGGSPRQILSAAADGALAAMSAVKDLA
ncbi:MAG: FAD-dependent oxidoreductase [Christensenellaceae bacterium]|jgi:thioredoxin reductase (NADPH)|nr:FAD-dependent oxidoreductase [Christensenellaceae bacterium]